MRGIQFIMHVLFFLIFHALFDYSFVLDWLIDLYIYYTFETILINLYNMHAYKVQYITFKYAIFISIWVLINWKSDKQLTTAWLGKTSHVEFRIETHYRRYEKQYSPIKKVHIEKSTSVVLLIIYPALL